MDAGVPGRDGVRATAPVEAVAGAPAEPPTDGFAAQQKTRNAVRCG